MQIALADLDSREVQELVRLHLDGMRDESPPESIHAMGLAALRSPEVTLWSASEAGHVRGIGALLVEPGATEGEIKSMRTDPEHLGRGVGRAILRAIVADAKARGLQRLSLETGATASFSAAHHLYLSEGFEPCGPFGSYREDPFSRYFTLSLPR